MPFIVLYNKKYKRQFEALVKKETWDKYVKRYGILEASIILLSKFHKVKSWKRTTPETERSSRKFMIGMIVRSDIYGEPIIKIGKSKKEVLDMGHSELVLRGIPYVGKEKKKRHQI
jgi:hypothetical protein